jgi:hypothetical protein
LPCRTSSLRSPRPEDHGPNQRCCSSRDSLGNGFFAASTSRSNRKPGSIPPNSKGIAPRKRARHWNKTPGSPNLLRRFVESGLGRTTRNRIAGHLFVDSDSSRGWMSRLRWKRLGNTDG